MLPVNHARTICRSLAKLAAAVALSLTGAGSWGTLRYIAAFSRFVGLHMAKNSGRDGGHALPLFKHSERPRLSSSKDMPEIPLDHVSEGVSP